MLYPVVTSRLGRKLRWTLVTPAVGGRWGWSARRHVIATLAPPGLNPPPPMRPASAGPSAARLQARKKGITQELHRHAEVQAPSHTYCTGPLIVTKARAGLCPSSVDGAAAKLIARHSSKWDIWEDWKVDGWRTGAGEGVRHRAGSRGHRTAATRQVGTMLAKGPLCTLHQVPRPPGW